MKHLNKKHLFKGAGKSKPKPKPAVLNPPKIGAFKVASSYSVAEIIDLISDGPIDGLVDQNGKTLKNDIFKGIYLDNTPIQNTETLSNIEPIGSINISSPLSQVANIWVANGKFKYFPYNVYASLIHYAVDVGGIYTRTEYIGYVKNLTGFLPTQWSLSGSIVHHSSSNLIASQEFVSFENTVRQLASNSNSSASKNIAEKNLNNLIKFKNKILNNRNIPNYKTGQNFRSDGLINSLYIYSSYIVIPINQRISLGSESVSATESLSFNINALNNNNELEIDYFLTPEISDNQTYTGLFTGFVVLSIPLKAYFSNKTSWWVFQFMEPNVLLKFAQSNLSISVVKGEGFLQEGNSLFNFTNVSSQFKNGEEFQSPLVNFDKIANDYFYESKLFGPYDRVKNIQRILTNGTAFRDGINSLIGLSNLTITNSDVLKNREGSVDKRNIDSSTVNNYSDWNDGNENRNAGVVSITHTIENPLTEEVSVSLAINSLSDTLHIDVSNVTSVGKLTAGSKIPATVILQIEIGKINNGQKSNVSQYNYLVCGLIEGSCIVDLGGDYQDPKKSIEETVKIIKGDGDTEILESYLNKPFPVPELNAQENPTTTKRYITVSKLSAETNSVLINKDVSVLKFTEFINQKLSYPFSAINGIKLDARAVNSIPERSYDCRLKKVKIPTNYFPLNFDGQDKRYVKKASDYVSLESVYVGDWDGEFKEGWTDNPAWILYDLLTSQRYGLGSYIEESQVNKWELYKIARFCDAVDDLGYFVGVSDGVGGLEPRFSCNIVFKEQTKIYDAINVVANLFRGIVFFGNSEINFLDDRPRIPIALFNNANVKDGIFNYSNTQRDQQFNTVEVVYLDRFDNYKTKVEYVQDEQDIRKRGVFKTTINTSGVTSRAMARRIGQHIIYQTTKENQTVDFTTGLEALLCRPGDLIVVEDEMKTRSSNFGKVLSIDNQNKTIRIDVPYVTGDLAGSITIYSPTGYSTSEDLSGIASKFRGRVNEFSISSTNSVMPSILTGLYRFSGYTQGISNSPLDALGNRVYPVEVPVYTGISTSHNQKLFCYYSPAATGFVFSTGLAFQNNTLYDKVITNTGVFYGVDFDPSFTSELSNVTGFTYTGTSNRRTSPSGEISGTIQWDSIKNPVTQGILDEEIDTYNISQIAKISITGFDNLDYGSLVYLNQNDPNIKMLPAAKLGSVYRLERRNASDQLYKIMTIREQSQNEYSVAASRYNTGKYDEIEKFVTEDFLPNTFNSTVNVNNVDVRELDYPIFAQFSGVTQLDGTFNLTGRWRSTGDGITGYRVSVSNSLAGAFFNQNNTPTQTGINITGLTDIGNWNLAVTALGNGSTRINSLTSTTGTFVAYSAPETTTLSKPIVSKFSLE